MVKTRRAFLQMMFGGPQAAARKALGAKRDSPVDGRIVAATHEDLEEDVRKGRFREDLFHRLNEFTLRLPPLREPPFISGPEPGIWSSHVRRIQDGR